VPLAPDDPGPSPRATSTSSAIAGEQPGQFPPDPRRGTEAMHQPNGTGALLLQQDREDQGKLCVSAEAACESLHKALPRRRHSAGSPGSRQKRAWSVQDWRPPFPGHEALPSSDSDRAGRWASARLAFLFDDHCCSVQPGNSPRMAGSLRWRVADGSFHGVTADARVKSLMIWASLAGWSRGRSV
jgi:hypothetical protein